MAMNSLERSSSINPLYTDKSITNRLLTVPTPPSKQRNTKPSTVRIIRNRNNYQHMKQANSNNMATSQASAQQFVYNLTQNTKANHANTLHPNNISKKIKKYPRRRRQKRRIRTFYSKKWGNRLYGLTTTYPTMTPTNTNTKSTRSTIPENPASHQETNRHLQIWYNEIAETRRAINNLNTFIEEENLDLNDMRSVRSVSPSASPMHLGVGIGFGLTQEDTYYDSAVSNVAANTDIEDEEDDDTHDQKVNSKLIQRQQSHNNNDSDDDNVNQENERSLSSRPNLKIIVSSPNNINDRDDVDQINDERNRRYFMLRARMKAMRSRRKCYGSDMESAASEDCSSSDDYDGDTTANEEDDDEDDEDEDVEELYNSKHSLFLSDSNLHRGIYSRFEYSDSETDYLSAQSDDFDELTICYHNRNDRNIKFRDNKQRLRVFNASDSNYLSDLGPSDIGSSDTECFSSADSIPDSIPPPVESDYLSQ